MKQFSDSNGRTWDVTINVPAVKRIRDRAGVDLTTIFDDEKLFPRLMVDPVLLTDALYAAINPPDVTDEQFSASIIGDVIDDATQAFFAALAEFLPTGKRAILQRAMEKTAELQAEGYERVMKALDDPDLMGVADRGSA